MSIFRRNRSTSHSRTPSAPPSADALTAASQVFLKNRASNSSLSSAAAAAALRTHAATPTDVSSVQTKRMVRRGSTSSIGSQGSSARTPFSSGVQRKASTGSLSERSLRAQSPNRSVSLHGDAPPVPPLPKQVARSGPPQRRASSAQPPARVASPPTLPNGRGSSVDPGRSASHRYRHPRVASVSEVSELGRSGSRASINFSRPISPAAAAPSTAATSGTSPAAKYRSGGGGWFTTPATTDQKPRETPSVAPDPSPTGLMASKHAVKEGSVRRVSQRPTENPTASPKGLNRTNSTALSTGPAEATSSDPQPAIIESPEGPPHVDTSTPGAKEQTVPSQLHPVEASLPIVQEHTRNPAAVERSAQRASPKTLPPLLVDGAKPHPNHLDFESAESTSSRGSGSRTTSLSPPRQARFAHTTLTPTKHQPPARPVSPAKSAMKRSPSRTESPEVNHHVGFANSTDSTNLRGESPNSVRRRKVARVSFDQEPIVVVPDAEPERLTSPLSTSPLDFDDLNDEVIKPRPALPSFGSVRGRRNREVETDRAEKVTETVSSSMNNSINSLEHSNDHIVGGVLSQDFAKKHAPAADGPKYAKKPHDPNSPLAPEVTSVEGTGYETDSSTSSDYEDVTMEPKSDYGLEKIEEHPSVEDVGLQSIPENAPLQKTTAPESVPAIAIQPATPKPAPESKDQFFMPGGFPQIDTQVVRAADAVAAAADDSSDNNSIYSDAAENVSDEEGGFASIDAILESPTVPVGAASPVPQSIPVSPEAVATMPPRPGATDWEAEKAYWSNVVQRQREDRERETVEAALGPSLNQSKHAPRAASSDVEVEPELQPSKARPQSTTVAQQPRRKPSQRPQSMPPEADALNVPKMRKSMRQQEAPSQAAQPSSGVHMRKSMRGQENPAKAAQPSSGAHMRQTMRPASAVSGLAASRHAPPPSTQKTTVQKNQPRTTKSMKQRPASAMMPTRPADLAMAPQLKRSNSADSVSSFRRSRPASALGTSRRTSMRQSLREPVSRPGSAMQGRAREMSPKGKAGRFRIRSNSPPASPSRMRSTLRSGSDVGSIKSNRPRSILGFGKSSKKAPPARSSGQAFRSRFADDSDDDSDVGQGPHTFQSRFADSDDEDDYNPRHKLTPVRGIPRRSNDRDGDSTDLEEEADESDGAVGQRRFNARPVVPSQADVEAAHRKAATNGTTGLASSRHAPPNLGQKKKRGFFGLGKKKEETPLSQVQIGATGKHPETPLKSALKQPGQQEPAAASPTSRNPKLQKRSKDARAAPDSWPLPAPDVLDERPNTSDGTAPGPSVSFAADDVDSLTSEPIGRSGKKKRFPMLRRAFGLKN